MVSQSADSLRASKGVLIRSRLIQGLHHLVDTLTFLRIRETCGLLLSKLKKLQPLRWSEDSHLRSLDPSLAASSARFDFDRFRAGYCSYHRLRAYQTFGGGCKRFHFAHLLRPPRSGLRFRAFHSARF